MSVPLKIGVIGPGKVGSFWARSVIKANHSLVLAGRKAENCPPDLQAFFTPLPLAGEERHWRDLDLIVLAIADSALPEICPQLLGIEEEKEGRRTLIAHLSGQLSPEILVAEGIPADSAVAAHPVYPFNTRQSSPKAIEVFHALEGRQQSCAEMQRIIQAIGGRSFVINDINRSLYHLACVLASNHLVTLFHVAKRLIDQASQSEGFPEEALLGLMEASVRNLRHTPASEALTGPAKRGDAKAITDHLENLRRIAPEYSQLYLELLKATQALVPEQSKKVIKELVEQKESSSPKA